MSEIRVRVVGPAQIDATLDELSREPLPFESRSLASDLRWLPTLRDGLRHHPYLLIAERDAQVVGLLPLCLVSSRLFGRFLVGLPYLNSGGVQSLDADATSKLLDQAVALADELDVRHLELRHETAHSHAAFQDTVTSKVHMRLALPATPTALWDGFKAKVRNQLRKGEQQGFNVTWGGSAALDHFYAVFSRNMRDLGTPVFGRELFASICRHFGDAAEFCVLSLGARPVAAALLLHGAQVTEVPSASSLREFNSTNANMFMYWRLLERSIERGARVFDFGRSSADSNTFRFKQQWGALPEPAAWQYYVRRGTVGDMRPESAKYRLAIRVWKKMPVWLTQWIGPSIVRGIP